MGTCAAKASGGASGIRDTSKSTAKRPSVPQTDAVHFNTSNDPKYNRQPLGNGHNASFESSVVSSTGSLSSEGKYEHHSRRRLSVSTVKINPETWTQGVVGTTHGALIKNASCESIPGPTNTVEPTTPDSSIGIKQQTVPHRTSITKYKDPAMHLVDERMGSITEVTVKMILELIPDALMYCACFGAPAPEVQTAFDDKTVVTRSHPPCKNGLPNSFGIGYACKKGLKPESPNQDDFMILKVDDWAMYGVFDGHGPSGHDISNFAHTTLPFLIMSDPLFETDTPATLRRAFRKVHHLLEAAGEQSDCYIDCTLSGSTCTVVVHRDNKLYVAHVGDSRCVLAQKQHDKIVALNLTLDHKPTIPDEKARIEAYGGEVRRLEGDIPHRVFVKNRMYPGLAMSRAIGDSVGTAVGVISDPDICVVNIQSSDKFLILCSDGVWEFITGQEAVDICSQKAKSHAMDSIDLLARESWTRWIEEEENVVDDITGIVVWLN